MFCYSQYIRNEGREEGLEVGRCEGIREGRKEGQRKGRKEGKLKTMVQLVDHLMKHNHMNLEDAMDMLGIASNDQKYIKQKLN